jgi:hypothetical protein
MGESLVAVSSFWSVPEAHVARNQLEAAGIQAVLQGEEGASIGIGSLSGGVKVLVRRPDVKRALTVLAETGAELEKALEGDAWEEGSHDEDRRAMEFEEELTEDEEGELITPGDRAADHAHRVAYMGILVFPILSHLYSSWLLFRMRANGQELTRGGERAAAGARRLNTIFLAVGGVILSLYVLSLLVR